jgi:hypothetical protein
MKVTRNQGFSRKPNPEDNDNVPFEKNKNLFAIVPILINLITITVLCGIYYYIIVNRFYPEYQNYIYWTVNVLITYNIIAASARSFIAPILSLLIGLASLIEAQHHQIFYLTTAQSYQLIIVGIIGLVIAWVLKI